MNFTVAKSWLVALLAAGAGLACTAGADPSTDLRVVIIRHGEKPKVGDNLTCQGENRARQLPAVLHRKFGVPDFAYVPTVGSGNATKHARMFQTIAPMAVRYNLTVNSAFAADAYADVSDSVRHKAGTVLMVWNHTDIPELAKALGIDAPPRWADGDFDSIWVIRYTAGKAVLSLDSEGLTPATACAD